MTERADQLRFPDGFLWGAATSAYQIEGSPLADGAGASIWHRFSHTPGRTDGGDTGDVACDHYNRWAGDVQLMGDLGLQAYRFSIAWGRIMPEGRGRVNGKGLDFYSRLVDALLERGIRPNVTLYHWDLPAALDDRGGWLNPDIAGWFADYASTVYRALDDRVTMWATLNEPWVVSEEGYLTGNHAPGHRVLAEPPLVAHNLVRAHAAAVDAYRAEGRHEIGVVVNLEPKYPASDDPADVAAARRAEAYMNRRYLDPFLLGRYPEELGGIFGDAWPAFVDDEVRALARPVDWVGINYYTRAVVRDDPRQFPVRAASLRQHRHAHTEMGWEVYPQALTDTLTWVTERYGRIPLYVTENGAAFYDPPTADGDTVRDPLRVAYFRDHLRAVRRAIDAGADVRGYYAWSLFDNFEWSYGYAKRFGIVHVDLETLARTPKESARYYAEVIRTHGESLAG
ncbi:MAG TPA: GH1 family beta-glucosidase [Gemmatimonadales bacterium]